MNKISLTGDLGSGKSTVAALIIPVLGAELYSTGKQVRALAAEAGMGIKEFNDYMVSHPEIDRKIDDGLASLSDAPGTWVFDSRMAWHFVRGTFKVYLSAEEEIASLRIKNAHRVGEQATDVDAAIKETRDRRNSERLRYKTQYGVDVKDLNNYSLVIDTSYVTPELVADTILSCYDRWCLDNSVKMCYLAPERLSFIDDEQDGELVARYAAMLEMDEPIPEITVFEENGNFYVDEGTEAVLAYSLNFASLVPVRLVKGSSKGKKYVRMKDSL